LTSPQRPIYLRFDVKRKLEHKTGAAASKVSRIYNSMIKRGGEVNKRKERKTDEMKTGWCRSPIRVMGARRGAKKEALQLSPSAGTGRQTGERDAAEGKKRVTMLLPARKRRKKEPRNEVFGSFQRE